MGCGLVGNRSRLDPNSASAAMALQATDLDGLTNLQEPARHDQ